MRIFHYWIFFGSIIPKSSPNYPDWSFGITNTKKRTYTEYSAENIKIMRYLNLRSVVAVLGIACAVMGAYHNFKTDRGLLDTAVQLTYSILSGQFICTFFILTAIKRKR